MVVTREYSGHSADSLLACGPSGVLDVSGRVHKTNLSKKSTHSRWKLSSVPIKSTTSNQSDEPSKKGGGEKGFGISTWTPTIELVHTCTRRKGCRAKEDSGADTEVTFLQTQRHFCPTYSIPRDAHAKAHVHARVHAVNLKDLLWIKRKHSDLHTQEGKPV